MEQPDPLESICFSDDPKERDNIYRTISRLSATRRDALLLYYFGGMNLYEIAAAMRILPEKAAEELARARETIFDELGTTSAALTAPSQQYRGTTLKEVLDRYVDDTITDDQVCSVLDPVIRMIHQGKFDSSRNPSNRNPCGII